MDKYEHVSLICLLSVTYFQLIQTDENKPNKVSVKIR